MTHFCKMQEAIRHALDDDPEFGIFITFGSTRSGKGHGIRVRRSSRATDYEPHEWIWSTIGMPLKLHQELTAYLNAILDEEITDRYGIIGPQPY